jgi:hypothetical protein
VNGFSFFKVLRNISYITDEKATGKKRKTRLATLHFKIVTAHRRLLAGNSPSVAWLLRKIRRQPANRKCGN